MKKITLPLILVLAVLPAFAQKPCEQLKTEITTALNAKGVKQFQLDIIASDKVRDGKVVGSCDGGKQKITYKKS